MLIDINEVQNSQVGKIPVLKYGKFVKGEKTANSDEFLLYISEDQCYFVDKNITWFPIDGCLAFGEDL